MDIGSFDMWFGLLGLLFICALFAYIWLWSGEPRDRKYAWTAMDASLAFLYFGFAIDARGQVETALSIGQFAFIVLFLVLIRRAGIEWNV